MPQSIFFVFGFEGAFQGCDPKFVNTKMLWDSKLIVNSEKELARLEGHPKLITENFQFSGKLKIRVFGFHLEHV